jgi:hypothetical protein
VALLFLSSRAPAYRSGDSRGVPLEGPRIEE